MHRRGLPLIDRAAQDIRECSPPDRIAARAPGQSPCRPGAVRTGQRPPRPAPGAEDFAEPRGIIQIDALPSPRQEPDRVLSLGRGHQCADPLILITPGQQPPPQFFSTQ